MKSLSSREYCLDCSPFGEHNTQQIHKDDERGVCKNCGKEFDPEITTGNTTVECSKCIARRRREERKKEIVEMFGGECEICGYSECISALEFHHKDPENKSFQIGSSLTGRSMDEIVKEAEKCYMICANCHRSSHCSRCDRNI
jgi:hypothetical protein